MKPLIKTSDIHLSTEVVTPHSKWAKPLAGGPVSALFVPGIPYGRDVIEIAQRFDVDFESVIVDRNWDNNKWGLGDFYDQRGGIWDDAVVMQNLEDAVCSDLHFDVMFIPGINGWRRFSDKAKDAILKRVQDGAGLVINQPQHGVDLPKVEGSMPAILEKDREDGEYRAPTHNDKWLAELSPLVPLHEERYYPEGYACIDYDVLRHDDWIFSDHYIAKNFPSSEIDFTDLGYYPYKAAGDVVIESASGAPIVAVKTVGRGRVVALGYLQKSFVPNVKEPLAAEGGCFGSTSMGTFPPEFNVKYDNHEYLYALVGRVMLWAAGRDKTVIIDGSFVGNSLEVVTADNATLSYRVKNYYDELVAEGEVTGGKIAIPAGQHSSLRFEVLAVAGDTAAKAAEPLPEGSGSGIHSRCSGGGLGAEPPLVIDWAVFVKENTVPASAVFAERQYTNPLNIGDVFEVDVDIAAKSLNWELYVLDDFENVIWQTAGSGSGKQTISYKVEATESLNLRAQARIITPDGLSLVKTETKRVIVQPASRGINDFEAFLSPMVRGNSKLLNIIGRRMRNLGVTGLFPGGNRTVASSGADGLGVYWYKRAEYIARKEDYLRTGDKKYLVRVPCLSDPAFWAEMEGKIEEAVTRSMKTSPIAYFANDEGSLTCYKDELELCFCEHTIGGMRNWLKEKYDGLDALNKAWKTAFTNWDDVMPDTYDEAYARNHFRAWGDHRLYMEVEFTGAYAKMHDMVCKYDKDGVLRMSGCQESSAYTGCDYFELHKHVGYFEAYGGGNQLEFHRSFMKPETMLGAWTGYGVNGITARHQIWSRVLHGISLHSMFWFYSIFNPDYTFPKAAVDLSKPLIELRQSGIGKLLLHSATRDALGVAMHYSMRSIHGAYAKGNDVKYAQNREGWVNILEDCGYQYNFVATPQIEDGELAKYRVLILPYSIDISEKEAEKIREFAQNGGMVIADFQTGVMNIPPNAPGIIDDVLGVERRNTHNRKFFTCHEFKRAKDFDIFEIPESGVEFQLDGFCYAEEGIRVAPGAKAAYYHDFAPALSAVVANNFGAGKGIYFNISMDDYAAVRKNGGEDIRSLIKNILTYAGIERFCTLSDPETGQIIEAGHETVYYSAPGAKFVAILRDMAETRAMSHDGLVVGGSADTAEDVEQLRINIAEKAHIYDMRTGEYYGETSVVETTLNAGDTKLLAILPEKLDRVECTVPAKIKRGDEFTIDISATTASDKTPEFSVFAVEITDPCGNRAWEKCENATGCGKVTLPRKMFYNAPAGTWKVTAKDVATGIKATTEFVVE